ncbi:glutathione S-transferase family protein [Pseudoduganella albidiflava]|uniref:glutathione transferase n=1 Tax=Pseudoduganella albidiflava TaxID=321983 RepID=A0A411WRY1_9BURK|nr:glutathione S-transferase [Pseudoduganella albidiflava]QBH99433.1 glutathione S-transferase [Pseudoduganella albidiflava]GGY44810.1 glutathione S-transferase [Pseudoduganella albidiflava]
MITVHHLNNSRSQRVLWLLEELGLPYQVVRYQRDARTMLAPPELKAVHPLGKSPVIVDGDCTVAESGAIIEYLMDQYDGSELRGSESRDGEPRESEPRQGRLRPPARTPEKRRWTYFLHYAEGSMMPPLLMKLIFDRVETAPAPFFVKPIARGIAQKVKSNYILPQIRQHLDYLEGELGRHEWFAGDAFSAADIQMSFPLEAAASRGGLDAASHPKLAAFLERIHARPAYQRALEQGGPYELLR